MSKVEYVIYCRKSTDESSGQQTQSIPDQIKRCIEYAKANDLSIQQKPLDFSDFETEREISLEDSDKEEQNREVYKNTRHLFIVKEQQSGKTPFIRQKWRKLIKMIEKGEIQGLLSYSPDRQARNIVEGGELINLVDEGKVELKYTNFHFEPNASGKMMLGIWFVFSKEYSDKLSEDVNRGNKSALSKGKAMGTSKFGYIIDKTTGSHQPDPKRFPLMRKAFEMKIYEKRSDKEIISYLNSMGFQRENNKNPLSPSIINAIWKDSFYYGLYKRGDDAVDLREHNTGYEPIISEIEYNILRERYNDKRKLETNKKKKSEYNCIHGLPEGILITKEDGFKFTFYLPNKKRRLPKLTTAQQANPKATYADIVKSSQIYYGMKNQFAEKSIDITFKVVEKAIIKKLGELHINETSYQAYVDYLSQKLDGIEAKKKKERDAYNMQINKLTGEKNFFIKKSGFGKGLSENEKVIYDNEVIRYDSQINSLQKEVAHIVKTERNQIVELEVLADTINKAGKYYKKANYVQKAKITEIFFSNILVDKEKRLTLMVKPGLEGLFSSKNPIWLGNQDSNLDKRSQSPVSYH